MRLEFTEVDRERLSQEASEEANEKGAEAPEEEVENEALEGAEDVNTEEAPEEEDAEGGESEEEATEEGLYEFVVEDEDGNEVTKKYSREELLEKLALAESNPAEELKEYREVVKGVEPLLDTVNNSALLQQVLQWKDQGYSDQQIMQGLTTYVLRDTQQQQQGGEDIPEETKQWLAYIEKIVEDKLAPVKNKLQESESNARTRSTISQNELVFEQALKKYYYTPELLSTGQKKKLTQAIKGAYPNMDIKKINLTKESAEMIVNYALGPRKGAVKEKSKVKQFAKQAQAPTIMPGLGIKTQARQKGAYQPPKSATIGDRQRTWHELFIEKE